MASTSVHRSVRNEENVGQGFRNAKSADTQAGSKPARKALGELTNTSRTPLSQGFASKKALAQTKPASHSTSGSSSRRKRTSKVDLDNPPDIERMTPYREKSETPVFDKEVLDCTKAYRTDLKSFLLPSSDRLFASKKDINLPADVEALFGVDVSTGGTDDEEVKLQELYLEAAAVTQEAASIGADLDPDHVDLDQLLEDLDLNLF